MLSKETLQFKMSVYGQKRKAERCEEALAAGNFPDSAIVAEFRDKLLATKSGRDCGFPVAPSELDFLIGGLDQLLTGIMPPEDDRRRLTNFFDRVSDHFRSKYRFQITVHVL